MFPTTMSGTSFLCRTLFKMIFCSSVFVLKAQILHIVSKRIGLRSLDFYPSFIRLLFEQLFPSLGSGQKLNFLVFCPDEMSFSGQWRQTSENRSVKACQG